MVGLFGAGKQARTQLKAVCSVRRIERVEVYSRDDDRRERVRRRDDANSAPRKLCRCELRTRRLPRKTSSSARRQGQIPVFDGRVLEEGTHINAIGSNFWTKAEIDVATVRRADSIVCDSIEQCRIEAGDFRDAMEEGVTDWRLMHELADVVTGRQTGRARPKT